MLNCISVENMRLSDADTIANLTPSLELMHRAAMGVYRSVAWQGRIAIVAGSGNNGGDGYALSCILKEKGFDCAVFTVGSRMSEDSAHYAAQAKAAGVPVSPFAEGDLDGFSMVVDCLLGTGFQGSVRENYRAAVESINNSDAFVVSVDINSGMNGDTGTGECIVRSDVTVTIGYVKNGLVTASAGKYMKKLICTDIGIRLLRQENHICSREEWAQLGFSPAEREVCREDGIYFLCPVWLDLQIVSAG